MTNEHEQYALAAMLVPEHVKFDAQCQTWFAASVYSRSDDDSEITAYRQWQPTADTEAGRSDALVLLAAVLRFMAVAEDGDSPDWVYKHWINIDYAMHSGDIEQLQHITFVAAVAIGEYIKGFTV